MSSEQSIRRVLRRVGGRVSAGAGAFGRNGREWRAGGKHSVVEVCRPWLHQSPKGASVWPGFPRKGGTPDARHRLRRESVPTRAWPSRTPSRRSSLSSSFRRTSPASRPTASTPRSSFRLPRVARRRARVARAPTHLHGRTPRASPALNLSDDAKAPEERVAARRRGVDQPRRDLAASSSGAPRFARLGASKTQLARARRHAPRLSLDSTRHDDAPAVPPSRRLAAPGGARQGGLRAARGAEEIRREEFKPAAADAGVVGADPDAAAPGKPKSKSALKNEKRKQKKQEAAAAAAAAAALAAALAAAAAARHRRRRRQRRRRAPPPRRRPTRAPRWRRS